MSEAVKKHLVVLLLYTVLTLVMTLPVALNLTTHIAGSGGDPWQTLWRFENLQQQAASSWQQGTASTFIAEQFFGAGEPRLINNSTWPWMPLHLLLGQPLAYNVIWILSFVLSGYFVFLLVDWLIKKHSQPLIPNSKFLIPAGPLLAGLLYMFLPFHAAHALGHFGAMQTQWLPLVIWLTFLFMEKQTWWRAIGLAVAITMQSWTEHHYLLWYVIFMIILVVLMPRVAWSKLIRNFAEFRGAPRSGGSGTAAKSAGRFAVTGPVALLLVLVCVFTLLPWWPTVQQAFSDSSEALELGWQQTIRFSADIFSFVIPASFHSIWGGPLATLLADDFTGNTAEATHYLGLVPLLLVIFFSQRTPKKQLWLWLTVAAVFGLIALGPRLHVLGTVTPIPLPYTLVDGLPVFSAVRAVGRASIMVGIALAVLFGWVVREHVNRRRFAGILGALILLEFLLVPVALQSAELSPVYEAVAKLPGQAVIELPAATNYTAASRALYASLEHGKASVGNIALERGTVRDDLANGRSLPALRQLLYLRSKHLQEGRLEWHDQDLVETFADTAAYVGARVVVVHQDSLSSIQQLAVANFLEEQAGLDPQEFGDVVLYELTDEFIAQGDGVFRLEDGQAVIVNP